MRARTDFNLEKRRAQVGHLHRGGVSLINGGDSGINRVKAQGVLPPA